jgi:hypothetical protein
MPLAANVEFVEFVRKISQENIWYLPLIAAPPLMIVWALLSLFFPCTTKDSGAYDYLLPNKSAELQRRSVELQLQDQLYKRMGWYQYGEKFNSGVSDVRDSVRGPNDR